MPGSKQLSFLFLLILLSGPLCAQQEGRKDDWVKLHMAGFSYDHSFRVLEETIGGDKRNLEYGVHSLGLHYSSFSGARLGFVTDLTLLFPFITSYESESGKSNSGFSLDYMGSVGWRLEYAPFTVIPYVGFHADYGFLSKDPVDDNESNHMLSLGFGGGVKGIYEISEHKGIFLGLRGTFNSVEFSSADYDSREIQLERKFTVTVSSGYSWRPR
jgi:hypothetical protein